MKFVREVFDEVHGFIDLTDIEANVLRSCAVMRLQRIRQLGPAYIVYPSATHTRFAHSLGTMFLADRLYSSAVQEPDDYERQLVRLAGLLHDMGHLPFSHALPGDHESLGVEVTRNYLGEMLEDYLERLVAILREADKLSPIISGEVDADRLDYLIRDSHHLGLPYKGVDLERVIRHARLVNLRTRWVLAFSEGAEVAIEALIVTRLELFRRVYHHKHVSALEALLEKLYTQMVTENMIPQPQELIENGGWCDFDDCYLLERIKDASKRGDWLGEASRMFLLGEIPIMVKEIILKEREEKVVRAIIEASLQCGVPENWIFFHLPRLVPFRDPESLLIIRDGSIERLVDAQGSFLSALKDFALSPIRIYTTSNYAGKLKECLDRTLLSLKP